MTPADHANTTGSGMKIRVWLICSRCGKYGHIVIGSRGECPACAYREDAA